MIYWSTRVICQLDTCRSHSFVCQICLPCQLFQIGLCMFGPYSSRGESSMMGLRVRQGYEGQGVVRLLWSQFLHEFPDITHFVYTGVMKPSMDRKLNICQTLSNTVCAKTVVTGTSKLRHPEISVAFSLFTVHHHCWQLDT